MDIRPLWKEHQLYKDGKIELVPTDWVWKYWGTDVSEAIGLNGKIVGLDALWADLLEKGMIDPLIMRVGINNKKMRLEAGNHRIQLLHKYGIKVIPITVQVCEECGPHLNDVMTDATNNFDATDELKISEITEEYMKPSDVFKSLSL